MTVSKPANITWHTVQMQFCKTCKYGKKSTYEWNEKTIMRIECHRHPPKLYKLSGLGYPQPCFPELKEDCWCGDWKVKNGLTNIIKVKNGMGGIFDEGKNKKQ
jgi:hypothetical protein